VSYIGNIVTTSSIDWDYLKKCHDISEADPSVPTLIVGIERAKALIREFNILNHTYDNNIFWTYGKRERRDEYDEATKSFIKTCVNKICEPVTYEFLDFIDFDKDKLKKLCEYINNNTYKILYNDYNRTLFIYDTVSKKVYGISLQLLEYIGRDKYKFLKWVSNSNGNILLTDMKFIPKDIIRIIDNERYLVPVLYETLNTKK
jgi:hypothetical protein